MLPSLVLPRVALVVRFPFRFPGVSLAIRQAAAFLGFGSARIVSGGSQ